MSIQNKVDSWIKTPAGKKKIEKVKTIALREGRTFGQDMNSISKQNVKDIADRMRVILVEKLSNIADVGVFIGDPVIKDNGDATIYINFDSETLHRDSLYQEGYPNGVDNILSLLVHGYTAKDYVYGYCEKAGKVIRSFKHRDKSEFLQQAIDEFNDLGIGIAELNNKYL